MTEGAPYEEHVQFRVGPDIKSFNVVHKKGKLLRSPTYAITVDPAEATQERGQRAKVMSGTVERKKPFSQTYLFTDSNNVTFFRFELKFKVDRDPTSPRKRLGLLS